MTNILNQTDAFTRAAQSGIFTTDNTKQGPSAGQVTQQFPRGGLGAGTPQDELMREKMEMIKKYGANTGMTPFGQVTATDKDFEYLRKKRDTEAAANLDAWISENFHTGDVTMRRFLQQVYPQYYEEREKLMLDRAKLALRIKLLLMRGPKGPKDLVLIWGLQTGHIKLDRDWDKIGPSSESPEMGGEFGELNRFKNGLMNPRRYLADSEREKNQVANGNPFAPKGTGQGASQTPAQFVGAVPSLDRFPSFLQGLGI